MLSAKTLFGQGNPSTFEEHHVTVTHRWAAAGVVALIAFGGLAVRAQDGVVAKVDGKTITEADMAGDRLFECLDQ